VATLQATGLLGSVRGRPFGATRNGMSHDATRRPHPPRRAHQVRPKRHAAAALPTTRNYPFDWAPSGLVQEQLGVGEVKRVDALAQMKRKFQAASYSNGVQVGPGADACQP
jgi:hypothetical protein